MLACYPPGSQGYAYHVDNPDRDGRVLTAIYYLNPEWVASRDGGALRVFPRHRTQADWVRTLWPGSTAAEVGSWVERTIGAALPAEVVEGVIAVCAAEAIDGGERIQRAPPTLVSPRARSKPPRAPAEVLASMTEAEYEDVLGMKSFGHRRKLSRAVKAAVASEAAKPVDVNPVLDRLLLIWVRPPSARTAAATVAAAAANTAAAATTAATAGANV